MMHRAQLSQAAARARSPIKPPRHSGHTSPPLPPSSGHATISIASMPQGHHSPSPRDASPLPQARRQNSAVSVSAGGITGLTDVRVDGHLQCRALDSRDPSAMGAVSAWPREQRQGPAARVAASTWRPAPEQIPVIAAEPVQASFERTHVSSEPLSASEYPMTKNLAAAFRQTEDFTAKAEALLRGGLETASLDEGMLKEWNSRLSDETLLEHPMVDRDESSAAEERRSELSARERELALREKLAEREAEVGRREARLSDREDQHRREFAAERGEIVERLRELSEREEKQRRENAAERAEMTERWREITERQNVIRTECEEQREYTCCLKEEEERLKELKRQLDERDHRWHEATKEAHVLRLHHAKPRLSPRNGKENVELQRQLEAQRGLVHEIKRNNGSMKSDAGASDTPDKQRDSWGSEATIAANS